MKYPGAQGTAGEEPCFIAIFRREGDKGGGRSEELHVGCGYEAFAAVQFEKPPSRGHRIDHDSQVGGVERRIAKDVLYVAGKGLRRVGVRRGRLGAAKDGQNKNTEVY